MAGKAKKRTDVIVTRTCIIGGIRRDEGDYLIRDGELTDGVTDDVLNAALLDLSAQFVGEPAASEPIED